jgi:Plant transposon protein
VQQSEYFCKGLNPNAVGQTGTTPLLKVIVAIWTLAYSLPCYIWDDMFEVSETTASMCLHEFARVVVECFDAEYLREPTRQDLIRIEKQFRKVGWPGCIGVVDCAGWFWKNAPTVLAGVLSGKEGKPCLRMRRSVVAISGFGISSLVCRVRRMISTCLKSALTSTESLPVRSPLFLQLTLLPAKSSVIFTSKRTAYILDGKSFRKPCRTLPSRRKSSTLETRNVPVFWLAVLYIVVRLTLADSKAVLLAYYASLRLFSCSYFTYSLRSALSQPNLLARRSRPLMRGLPRRRRGRG